MHGDPFRNMLMAAETFVGQLRDGDRVSIVAFSDGVYLAAPPVIIDGNTRNLVIASIRTLGDGGGTNLGGGFLAGLAQVFGAFNPWQVNQVVLFSDGQPNIGITSSSELARIAARAAERGVAVTTIGFGMEHDELLMQGMADASGGNYYYVDSPGDMSRIFQQEAGAILRTAARSTDVDLVLPRGRHARGRDRLRLRRVGRPHLRAHRQRAARSGTLRRLPLQRRPRRPAADRARVLGSGAARALRRVVRARIRRAQRRARQLGAGAGGRAEAALGLQESMAWADSGSEMFVISQIGYTRGIIEVMRERLGPQALGEEDKMLLDAQVNLGLKVGTQAAQSFLGGGVRGLMNFGAQQAASNATTAVAYNVDKAFKTRVRVTVQTNWQGASGTRYVARGTPYKPRDRDASLRFKRARYSSYQHDAVALTPLPNPLPASRGEGTGSTGSSRSRSRA